MINIDQVLLMDEKSRREQIRIRKELKQQLVGQLYTEVLASEIAVIQLSLLN